MPNSPKVYYVTVANIDPISYFLFGVYGECCFTMFKKFD